MTKVERVATRADHVSAGGGVGYNADVQVIDVYIIIYIHISYSIYILASSTTVILRNV